MRYARKCKHPLRTSGPYVVGSAGSYVPLWIRCDSCHDYMSRGKSNDKPAAVRIEIRAARLEFTVALRGWTKREVYGLDCAHHGRMPDRDSELPGWLCHEIDNHWRVQDEEIIAPLVDALVDILVGDEQVIAQPHESDAPAGCNGPHPDALVIESDAPEAGDQ